MSDSDSTSVAMNCEHGDTKTSTSTGTTSTIWAHPVWERVLNDVIAQSIKQVFVHPVTFEYTEEEELELDAIQIEIELDDEDQDHHQNNNQNNHQNNYKAELKSFLSQITWDTMVFSTEYTEIHSFSRLTGNDDSRGGGCGNLNLPSSDFSWRISCPNGITVSDVTEAVYRMKGSKYDYWYELFHSVTVSTTKNCVDLECDFGYGS